MTNRFEGKRVIITGAVDNIGEAAASLFVKDGARVVIADTDERGGAKCRKR